MQLPSSTSRFQVYRVICLLLLASSFVVVAFGSEVSISGTVRFPDGEIPLAAFVSLSGPDYYKATETDDQGHYAFSDVPNGTYSLSVFAGGHMNSSGAFTKRDIELTAGTTRPLTLNVILSLDPGEIRQQ
jgi:hypothetical protein